MRETRSFFFGDVVTLFANTTKLNLMLHRGGGGVGGGREISLYWIGVLFLQATFQVGLPPSFRVVLGLSQINKAFPDEKY